MNEDRAQVYLSEFRTMGQALRRLASHVSQDIQPVAEGAASLITEKAGHVRSLVEDVLSGFAEAPVDPRIQVIHGADRTPATLAALVDPAKHGEPEGAPAFDRKLKGVWAAWLEFDSRGSGSGGPRTWRAAILQIATNAEGIVRPITPRVTYHQGGPVAGEASNHMVCAAAVAELVRLCPRPDDLTIHMNSRLAEVRARSVREGTARPTKQDWSAFDDAVENSGVKLVVLPQGGESYPAHLFV